MADLDEGQLALLRDIGKRRVFTAADTDIVFLDLGDESVPVSAGAWGLYIGRALAEPEETADENGLTWWRLTAAGRSVLEEADRGRLDGERALPDFTYGMGSI